MRFVIATPLYPPEVGGPATYAKLLVAGLPARGIEVELVAFSSVRHLPKLVRHIAYYWRVSRALKGADLVLALDPVSVGLPACLAAWRAGKPLVVKVVGDYAWEQGRQRFGVTQELDTFVRTPQRSLAVRLLQRIEAGVAARAVRIIVPSEYLKGIVLSWDVPREKIAVIYNAVELEEAGAVPHAVSVLGRPLVVSVGRLVPWKGFAELIRALARLRKGECGEPVEASLAIVGAGPLQARLASLAQQELGEACVFTGALSHADTLATLAAADLFALNSSYEGLSHTLIEACLAGAPVLATAVGGNPEVIEHDRTGMLVPAGEPDALDAALMALLANAPLRKRLGASAKLKAAERFSVEAMLKETTDLLEPIVDSSALLKTPLSERSFAA